MNGNKSGFNIIEIVVVFCGILCVFIGIDQFERYGEFSWFFLLGLIMVVISHVVFERRVFNETEAKRKKREMNRIIREREIIEESNRSGKMETWNFPAEEFYRRCFDSKVADMESEFCQKKARSTAEQIIREAFPGADMSCFQSYLTKEKLQGFLEAGKPQAETTARRELAERKRVRPVRGNSSEETFIKRASAVSYLTGCEKRVKMLTDLLHDCDQKIEDMKAGEEAMMKLAMVYAGAQKKESDWAILGGAANGIAGPVASAAVIWDTMKKNGEIAQYNEGMRKASADVLSGTITIAGDRYKVEKERENVKQRLEEAKEKVSLSKPDAKEILQSFNVDTKYGRVTKNDSGVLKCTLDIKLKEPLALDVPEGLNMVVDGTVRAKVMMEDIYVGDVDFPLPIYGIPCDMTKSVTLDGMCDQSMEYDGKYTLELAEEQNLWVMEA